MEEKLELEEEEILQLAAGLCSLVRDKDSGGLTSKGREVRAAAAVLDRWVFFCTNLLCILCFLFFILHCITGCIIFSKTTIYQPQEEGQIFSPIER